MAEIAHHLERITGLPRPQPQRPANAPITQQPAIQATQTLEPHVLPADRASPLPHHVPHKLEHLPPQLIFGMSNKASRKKKKKVCVINVYDIAMTLSITALISGYLASVSYKNCF
uniref:Transmembrane protein n=1 Tax=Steinernema glaseri TaxID=37863 RepID=A0A1I8A9F0_9BILA